MKPLPWVYMSLISCLSSSCQKKRRKNLDNRTADSLKGHSIDFAHQFNFFSLLQNSLSQAMMTCTILGGGSWWNLPKSNKIVCIMHLVWIQQYNHAIFNTVGTAVVWTVGPGLRLLLRAVAQLPGLPGCLRGAGKWSNISNSLSFASITAIH